MQKTIFLFLSYILGSVPFGLIVVYLVKGIDIRKFGSGNIGATNVVRVVGKKWGILVFVLDFLKGFFPPFAAKFFLPADNYIYISIAILSVLGHIFPVFLKFKGGKGVATSIGALCGLSIIFPKLWFVLLISLGIWLIVFFVFRYVSLASLLLGLSFFVFSVIFALPREVIGFSLILCIFISIRHTKNIKNLFTRKEHRF
ncbi:MAG: glycerol-3-phosphate 1-O-acyltransferase PlsY [Candidatus Omnitrophota bacterium]|jgi:glycerol-3-phosphate acyltransferase PlsY